MSSVEGADLEVQVNTVCQVHGGMLDQVLANGGLAHSRKANEDDAPFGVDGRFVGWSGGQNVDTARLA